MFKSLPKHMFRYSKEPSRWDKDKKIFTILRWNILPIYRPMILCSDREDSNQAANWVIIKLFHFIEMLCCEFEHHIMRVWMGGGGGLVFTIH